MCVGLKAVFHSSQNPTRKLAARTFIQSQYLKAMSGNDALVPSYCLFVIAGRGGGGRVKEKIRTAHTGLCYNVASVWLQMKSTQ